MKLCGRDWRKTDRDRRYLLRNVRYRSLTEVLALNAQPAIALRVIDTLEPARIPAKSLKRMVDLRGEGLNRFFDVLSEWNAALGKADVAAQT